MQCAPLQGWDEVFFYSAAVDLYLGLLESNQITAEAMGAILGKHQSHAVGGQGWKMLRHWQIAVMVWDMDLFLPQSILGRHRGFIANADKPYMDSYDVALREFVRRELVSYYFDHWEHAPDVSLAMRLAGKADQCDAHGVAAFFNTRADVANVRAVFNKIAQCPRTITLEVYLEAVNAAYDAAIAEGHAGDLRALENVTADIDRHAPHGRRVTDKDQRRIDPHDSSMRYAHVPTPPPSMPRPDDDINAQTDSLSAQDTGNIIIKTVVNVQQNQNAIGVQVSREQVDEVERAVNDAPPSALNKALKEWVPQAVIGATVVELLKILIAS